MHSMLFNVKIIMSECTLMSICYDTIYSSTCRAKLVLYVSSTVTVCQLSDVAENVMCDVAIYIHSQLCTFWYMGVLSCLLCSGNFSLMCYTYFMTCVYMYALMLEFSSHACSEVKYVPNGLLIVIRLQLYIQFRQLVMCAEYSKCITHMHNAYS